MASCPVTVRGWIRCRGASRNSLLDLAGYLVSLDVAFEVLHPPELRDLLRRLAERYAAAARADEYGADRLRPGIPVTQDSPCRDGAWCRCQHALRGRPN